MYKVCRLKCIIFFSFSLTHLLFGQEKNAIADSLYDSIITEVESKRSSRNYKYNIDLLGDYIASSNFKSLHCQQRAILYHKLGRAYYSIQDYEQALEIFTTRAIPLWNDCEKQTKVEEADTYFGAAMAGQKLNEFDNSISNLNYSLELYEAAPKYSLFKLGHRYRGAGVLHQQAGEYELAEVFYFKAMSYFKQSNNGGKDLGIAWLHNDLGLTYQANGMFRKAVEFYEKSYVMHESIEVSALHNLVEVYSEELNEPVKASYYSNLLNEKAIENGNINAQVSALNVDGRIEFKKKNYVESLSAYNKALDLCRQLIENNHNIRVLAGIHENISESELKSGNYKEAIDAIDTAIDLMLPNQKFELTGKINVGDAIVRNLTELIEMIAFRAKTQYQNHKNSDDKNVIDSSLDQYFKIDSLFQLSLADISLNRSQIDASGNVLVHYESAIAKNLEQFEKTSDINYFNAAYYFSSRLKALNLSSSLRKYRKLNEADKIRSNEINSELKSLLVDYYNGVGNTDSISVEIIKKQRKKHQFEKNIINDRAGLSDDSVNSSEHGVVAEIQNKLHDNEILIEFFEGIEKLYVFKIGKSAVNYNEIDTNENIINEIDNFVQACQSPNVNSVGDMQKMGSNLYTLLFANLFDETTTSIKRLIFIPDGRMHSIPLDALIKDKDYLIQLYDIKYAYSHKLYFDNLLRDFGFNYVGFGPSYSNQLAKKIVAKRLAKLEGNLVDIPMAVEEVESSLDNYEDGRAFINSDATKEEFLIQASSADILHLSMHGLVDYETPDNSSLLFHDGVDDFALRASEIGQLDIDPDLVILSSCQSASGQINRAEGVQGLSRAFILAGSSAVLSSLWNTSEYSSSVLLPDFLNSLKQSATASTSLREAKLSYLSSVRPSLKHPFYWANFILISSAEASPNSLQTPLIVLFGLLTLLLLLYFLNRKAN